MLMYAHFSAGMGERDVGGLRKLRREYIGGVGKRGNNWAEGASQGGARVSLGEAIVHVQEWED